MSSPREKIKTVRDYEQFLRARGFSIREAKILARSYKNLDGVGKRGESAGEAVRKH